MIKTHKGDDYLKLLSTKDAAKILNVNPSRVRQLKLAGRLPAMKIGGSLVFKEKDLKKVQDRKVGRPKKKKRRIGNGT